MEILGLLLQWGRDHHLLRGTNDLTSPVGREPITDMNLLIVILHFALPPRGLVPRGFGRAELWVDVVVTVRSQCRYAQCVQYMLI